MKFSKLIPFLCAIFLTISVSATTANQTSSKVLVNGSEVKFDAYNIDESNYFKLRDIAYILNGTDSEFNVGWDDAENTVLITTGEGYISDGSEMSISNAKTKTAYVSTATIMVDGVAVVLDAYNIGDNNYVKLRHLAAIIGFYVDWDDNANAVIINE